MTFITLDEPTVNYLKKNHLSLDSIPAAGEIIFLKETANLSTGGSAEDVTDVIHEDNRHMCERAARVVGLDVCGIDLILEDITRSWMDQKGGIIEVNAGPGIRMHLFPSRGKSRDVAKAIIDHLYPINRPSRIPIIAITGTNGKTTVSRLITHILNGLDLIVGNTTTDGITIGKKLVARGDTTGPASARVVLTDPAVEVAVLETARGGIMRRGLGYDWSDVGIITNIQADHIGQDGIENLDDILRVKSLVVERVRKGGFIILNADSPPLRKLIEDKTLYAQGRKLILLSCNPESELVQKHVEKGNRAYLYHDGAIYEVHGQRETYIINVRDIPLTVGGSAQFQIENALAAFAACDVMEVPLGESLDGLRSFYSFANAGRSNLYRVGKGHLLVDYGHNPEAIRAIGKMVKNWHHSGSTVILGVPGDRSDEMISFSGVAAAEVFEKIIVREDRDLRGRMPGEVPEILHSTILKINPEAQVEVFCDTRGALKKAIKEMDEYSLLVCFYEERDEVEEIIREYDGKLIHDYSRIIPLKEVVSGAQAWH